MKTSIKIATRKSKLALWQANFVKSAIEKKYPECEVTLVEVLTEGDRQQTVALASLGGKSNFVKALQEVLLRDEADIAVHSMKDMSVYETEGLTLAAICERADARDAFISNNYADIISLPANAIVGTASPRRECILKSLRPDISVQLLRGNVDTRIGKLDNKEYDAIILAAAGLERLGLGKRIRHYLPEDIFIPAIAQGAIAIECRTNDPETRTLLRFLNHEPTALCVTAERRVNQILGGNCHSAIAAHATINNNQLQLSALVGSVDGKTIIYAQNQSQQEHAIAIGEKVGNDLLMQGAKNILTAE